MLNDVTLRQGSKNQTMSKEAVPAQLVIYQTADGKRPYEEWLSSLDQITQARIDSKMTGIVAKGGGKIRNLEKSLFEVKFDFGPGYRVYCGRMGSTLIIILCGGDKSTQARKDIKLAEEYWDDYKRRIS